MESRTSVMQNFLKSLGADYLEAKASGNKVLEAALMKKLNTISPGNAQSLLEQSIKNK